MNTNAKAWWKSRTLMFNATAGAAAVLPQLEQALPILQPLIPPQYYMWLSGVVVLGNVILRAITNAPIAMKDGEPWP